MVNQLILLRIILQTQFDMKTLFTVTAAIEAGTGLIMITFPSVLARILLGSSLLGPVALTIARIAGVAIFALGAASWLYRNDDQRKTARGLIAALMIFNVGTSAVLIFAGLRLGLSCLGLWSVVMVHTFLAVWCILRLNVNKV
jgi:hypothetical protein